MIRMNSVNELSEAANKSMSQRMSYSIGLINKIMNHETVMNKE